MEKVNQAELQDTVGHGTCIHTYLSLPSFLSDKSTVVQEVSSAWYQAQKTVAKAQKQQK